MKKWLSSVKDWYASNDRYSRNQRSSTPSLPHAPSGSCLEVSEDTIVAIKKCDHQRTFLQWSFSTIPSHARCSYHGGLGSDCWCLELSKPENKGKLVFYAGMDKVKFKKQVVPGDQLVMTATFVKRRGTIAVVEAKAEVDGKLAASGTLTFAIGN